MELEIISAPSDLELEAILRDLVERDPSITITEARRLVSAALGCPVGERRISRVLRRIRFSTPAENFINPRG